MPNYARPHLLLMQTQPELIRQAKHDDEDHLVVPVIGLVEKVLNGAASPFPELALAEDFGKVPDSWNGRPVTLNHPMRDGQFVSAGEQEIAEKETVGRIFNTTLDGDKLKMELWLQISKMPEEELTRLKSGEEIEVSTGYFADIEPMMGTFKNEEFFGIQRDIKPDHIAILEKGAIGACNFAEGCGGPRIMKEQAEAFRVFSAKAAEIRNNDCDCQELTENEKDRGIIAKALNAILDLLKIHKEDNMDKEKTFKALVAAGVYNEDDKKIFMALSEKVIETLAAGLAANESEASDSNESEEDKSSDDSDENDSEAEDSDEGKDEDSGDEEDSPQTLEALLASTPNQDLKDSIMEGQATIKAERASLSKGIMGNKRSNFTQKDLDAKPLPELRNLAKLADVADYRGQAVLKDDSQPEATVFPRIYSKAKED